MNVTQAFSCLAAAAKLEPTVEAALRAPLRRLQNRTVTRGIDIEDLVHSYGTQLAAVVTRPEIAPWVFTRFTRALGVGEVQPATEDPRELVLREYLEAPAAWVDFAERSIAHAITILRKGNTSAKPRPIAQPLLLDPAVM